MLLFLHAQCFIYIALLLTFTIGGIRSAYLLLFPIIFHSLTTVVNMAIKFKLNFWIYVHLTGQLIPLIYFCSLTTTVFAVFIPMTGRGDPTANPDLMMALFSVLMSLFLVGLLAPLIVLLPKIRYFFIVVGLMLVTTIVVMFTSVGFPFREATTPQRYYIFVSIVTASCSELSLISSTLPAPRTKLLRLRRFTSRFRSKLLPLPDGSAHTRPTVRGSTHLETKIRSRPRTLR